MTLTTLTMEQFFSQAGEYRLHEIEQIEHGGHIQHEVVFLYDNGHSRFDGRNWQFAMYPTINRGFNIFTGKPDVEITSFEDWHGNRLINQEQA